MTRKFIDISLSIGSGWWWIGDKIASNDRGMMKIPSKWEYNTEGKYWILNIELSINKFN